MDRHVTPRKVVRIGEKATKRRERYSRRLRHRGGRRSQSKSVIEQALDKELKELREVE